MTVLLKLVWAVKEVETLVTLSPSSTGHHTHRAGNFAVAFFPPVISCSARQHSRKSRLWPDQLLWQFVDKICCTQMNTIWRIHWSHLTHAQPPNKHPYMKLPILYTHVFLSERTNVLKKRSIKIERGSPTSRRIGIVREDMKLKMCERMQRIRADRGGCFTVPLTWKAEKRRKKQNETKNWNYN